MIQEKYLNSMAKLLNSKEEDIVKKESFLELTESQSSTLRWHTMSFLNSLKTVLIAWQYSIVDREIIENELSYLFSTKDGHAALKYFRHAAGGEESYPAIEIFSNHIEEKRRRKLIEKVKII